MRIHLIAIGGAAMHNIAISLHINHHTVSGSDDEIYNPAHDRLASYGLLPDKMGWFPERISKDIDVIILGMHARADNPELKRAQELGLRIVSYPEFVYEQAKDKTRVVVAGSHGKTTTTAMILHVLEYNNIAFDYLVGAQLEGFDNMVQFSAAPIMVIEGDEYLSSPIDRRPKFLHYRPHIAILTGIAWDHINVFPTFDNYKAQFAHFVDSLAVDAHLFYYQHDPYIAEILRTNEAVIHTKPYETFESKIEQGKSYILAETGEWIPLKIFGQHNLENLKAAYHACQQLGVSTADFYKAIPTFGGAAKRLQLLCETERSIAYQDFAHAPSKVAATIKSVQQQYPKRQLIACLELHTFSSLNRNFLHEYAGSMDSAEAAVVYYNEHTLKMKRLPDLSEQLVGDAFGHSNLRVLTEQQQLVDFLKEQQWENTNLLMMSSGTFGGLDMKQLASQLLIGKIKTISPDSSGMD